jgi:23S rRNA (cytosine1962-C5)-methyltransferase
MKAPVMDNSLLVADDWADVAVEDSGAGWKLERYGPYRFARPDPQALWLPAKPVESWQVDARFSPAADENEEMGRWRLERDLPAEWPLRWGKLTALARCTPFRHLGLFPEQSPHWRFAMDACTEIGGQPEVLNLFGYTGMASLACAAAGARVTHVDASKKAIAYARQNQAASGLEQKPIRWIVDDAFSFVQREIRRGRRYDGVILDPPKYGRGPNGEVWRLEEGLFDLLASCAQLLRRAPDDAGSAAGFLIATVYAVRLSHVALAQTAAAAMGPAPGIWQSGDMALPHCFDKRLLPTAIYARWRGG